MWTSYGFLIWNFVTVAMHMTECKLVQLNLSLGYILTSDVFVADVFMHSLSGMIPLHLAVPGFLKLRCLYVLFVCMYVCVCVHLEAVNN